MPLLVNVPAVLGPSCDERRSALPMPCVLDFTTLTGFWVTAVQAT